MTKPTLEMIEYAYKAEELEKIVKHMNNDYSHTKEAQHLVKMIIVCDWSVAAWIDYINKLDRYIVDLIKARLI